MLSATSMVSVHASDYRQMLQADAEGWIDGRATWFEHPWTGSCGYGKLDTYQFGNDAVAAMPDVREINIWLREFVFALGILNAACACSLVQLITAPFLFFSLY